MTSPVVLTKRQQANASRMRAQLNTALDHLYQCYQGLNILILADDLDELRSTQQLMQTQRLCWKLYDLWIEGAMLLTGMQQNAIPMQLSTELEKEGR
jgi:hypothetical protein